MDKNTEKKSRKVNLNTFILSVAIFVVVLIILLAIIVYRFSDRVSFSDKLSVIAPFPAIIIDKTDIVTIKEIGGNLSAIKRFYEKQDFSSLGYRVDFDTEEGKKRLKIRERELINKMIEDSVIEKIAKEKGINITDKLVDESVERKMNEYGSEDSVKDNLEKLYGWSLNDFKEKIVKPSLYKDELEEWVSENEKKEENQKAKQLAEEAMKNIDSGADFSKVATDSSLGATSENGGRMGWFRREYLISEIQDVIISLEEGDTSNVLESKLGYHIVKLEGKKNDDEGVAIFDLSQIYFPKASFANWLDEEIKDIKVSILIEGYVWNTETGMVEFQDKEMEKFEEKALIEDVKDPSLLSI